MDQKEKTNNITGARVQRPGFLHKAKKTIIEAVDQNEDGKLDLKDISIMMGSLGATTKKKVTDLMDSAKESEGLWNEKRNQQRLEAERNTLRPIFQEDIEKSDFVMPKLIRVTEMDKKRAQSEICRGSIGYESIFKEYRVINIFREHVGDFPLSFYPEKAEGAYYVDPVFSNRYIAMEEYFAFLKVARVNELQKIAQDLGAKHFRVIYKEQSKDAVTKKASTALSAKMVQGAAGGGGQRESAYEGASQVRIAAEMEFEGHAPVEPTLVYLKRETCIQMLISLRMGSNSMKHQKYTLRLSNSSGIKVKDAIKIDGALNAMKCAGNVTVASEAQKEAERYFEYEIDF